MERFQGDGEGRLEFGGVGQTGRDGTGGAPLMNQFVSGFWGGQVKERAGVTLFLSLHHVASRPPVKPQKVPR